MSETCSTVDRGKHNECKYYEISSTKCKQFITFFKIEIYTFHGTWSYISFILNLQDMPNKSLVYDMSMA